MGRGTGNMAAVRNLNFGAVSALELAWVDSSILSSFLIVWRRDS